MQFLRGLPALRSAVAPWRGAVATIGGFDGVHRGHQALLTRLRARAAELQAPSLVISFEPTPREFFMGAAAPARLQRFREKYAALQDAGVDYFLCLRFNEALRNTSPEQFVLTILCEQLAIRGLVVGHDFKFGKGRQGTVDGLRQLGAQHGFSVEEFSPYCADTDRISSTLVREALAGGYLSRAAELLGRPYVISGRVIHGKKLGRELGYPTANLRLLRRVIPLFGVFAVRVSGAGLQHAPAVANLGTRPVVQGAEPLLEVHVFDYAGDLYGKHLQVEFIARLRDEVMFPDLPSLVKQIDIDAAQARALLASA